MSILLSSAQKYYGDTTVFMLLNEPYFLFVLTSSEPKFSIGSVLGWTHPIPIKNQPTVLCDDIPPRIQFVSHCN